MRKTLFALTVALIWSSGIAAAQAKLPVAFKGTFSGSVVREYQGQEIESPEGDITYGPGGTGTLAWSGNVKFVRKPKSTKLYVTKSGLLTRTYTQDGACPGQIGPASYAIGKENAVILFGGKPKGKRAGKRFVINPDIVFLDAPEETARIECPDGSSDGAPLMPPWIGTDSYPPVPRSGVVGGTFEEDGVTWSFDLKPVFRR